MTTMPEKYSILVKLLNSKYIALLDVLALIVFWVLIYLTFSAAELRTSTAVLASYIWGVAGALLWLNETRPKWLFDPLIVHERVLGPKAIMITSVLWPISMLMFYLLIAVITVLVFIGEVSSIGLFGKKRR